MSVTEPELLEWFSTLSNWSRWGDDDERGTLNFVTPETRVAAAGLVRLGESVSCARPITGEATVRPRRAEIDDHGSGFAMEDVRYPVHGVANTHLDALPHAFWQGRMFNGRTQACDGVEAASTGIFTRGLLFDLPDILGVDHLDGGHAVGIETLRQAEASLGIQARPGDVILLRTGQTRREDDGEYAGWGAETLPWLHERAIAAIGADGPTETLPSGYAAVPTPVHQIGLTAMGLWLLDNLALDALAETAARLGRWEFCFTAAPLRFVGGSGSLLNPIATF